jgi:hypothetical protein
LIGEGGMGSVYMAEQEKPVSRKVALKGDEGRLLHTACCSDAVERPSRRAV